jgi:pimeloyl-ACP methyl ester carboxylesterase
VGAVGFSFGATQALIAAAELPEEIRAVVGFGGYCDLSRMVRCLFTGEHEWEGVRHRLDPDPYGRWILAGNFLARVPGLAGMEAVARHARELALESGRRGTWAWEAEYDAFKADVRRGLSPAEREVWDAVAPMSGAPPADTPFVRDLADGLAAAIRETAPELDPRARLDGLRGRIILSHGRADRLIPWTETLRLRTLLPPSTDVSVTITGLFAHSAHAGWMHPVERAREAGLFVRLMNRSLGAV